MTVVALRILPAVFNVPDQYSTIQSALAAADEGTRIRVAPGTYNEQIDFLGKAVTIESTGGAAVTIIDGSGFVAGSLITCVNGEGPDSVLRGFTVANGTAGTDRPNQEYTFGGGLYVDQSSPTITECIFTGCSAGTGGAGYLARSAATITDCAFRDNTSQRNGGALHLQVFDGAVRDCRFRNNVSSQYGGAVHVWRGTPVLSGSTFIGNRSFGGGGALSMSWNDSESGNALIDGCVIVGNSAQLNGGAIWFRPVEGITPGWVEITNTLICSNSPDNFNATLTEPPVDLGGNAICGCLGDLDADGVVDGADLLDLLGSWGFCPEEGDCVADLNGDRQVDGADLSLLLSAWGGCS